MRGLELYGILFESKIPRERGLSRTQTHTCARACADIWRKLFTLRNDEFCWLMLPGDGHPLIPGSVSRYKLTVDLGHCCTKCVLFVSYRIIMYYTNWLVGVKNRACIRKANKTHSIDWKSFMDIYNNTTLYNRNRSELILSKLLWKKGEINTSQNGIQTNNMFTWTCSML